MKSTVQKIKSPDSSIWVELDVNEIYPNNPGQGTPVLVCLKTGETGTWNCVTSEGEVDGVLLTDEQRTWLESITNSVEAWMHRYGV